MSDSKENETNCEEKDVKLELEYVKIGNMFLFYGEIIMANNHFKLNLNHEDNPIQIEIQLKDIISIKNDLDNKNEESISLKFRPGIIKEIGTIVERYGFVFCINSSNKSELEFILRFQDLTLEQKMFVTEFFTVENQNNESDVEIVDVENVDKFPRKKKLLPIPEDIASFDEEHPKKKQCKLQKSETVVHEKRRNSKDQRPRRNSQCAPQRDENVPPSHKPRRNTHEESQALIQTRTTRTRTRANYSEQNNFVLEDISEEQQYQEALRRSLKTHKKENPNTNNVTFGESSVKTDSLPFQDVDKNLDLFSYHTSTRGLLIVKMEDYLCLSRKEYLSDVDIDFYLQYIYNEKMSTEQQKRTYIFGSHFYSLYATSSEFSGWKNNENAGLSAIEKRYNRVDGIVDESVNLFEKDFLVFPLMDRNHWFLAIVCFPGLDGIYSMDGHKMSENEIKQPTKLDGALVAVKVPSVLIFDSIGGNTARRITAMNHIKNFLKSEYEHKYKNTDLKKSELIGHAVHCPLQLNNYDCGCFLLEFFERFFVKSPLESFRTPLDLNDWFNPDNLGCDKRREIAETFKLMMGDSQISLPDIQFKSSSEKNDVKTVEDNDASNNNNNDNNAIGNEEFNNNNFNCPDINSSLQHENQIESSQTSLVTVSSSTNVEEFEKTSNNETITVNDSEKMIQENITELMNVTCISNNEEDIEMKEQEVDIVIEMKEDEDDDEGLGDVLSNNSQSNDLNHEESIVLSD
ncbi:hypothetical protein PVAND_000177 [Polypedilum vanderplanki]|uniref:Ubiquitin-like protease family profile domain-containing protein n=1 Tax=Polypedilum vanderplanki TaxID=319348 RepID=A0A9J6BKI2_POLVA|nr:hypothetical protein PVAND_000177 [Polypedilum vanderplanki]